MASQQRQLHLNAFILGTGHHEAAWRSPLTTPERVFDPSFFAQQARTAEAAKFDAIFLADIPKLDDNIQFNTSGRLDPLIVLATVAAATERIGLIGTASTTYSYPWALARALATLDFMSNGRAAWNIVTTDRQEAAENHGLSVNPDHAARYARAEEYVEVVLRLWDSWEDDAIVLDREGGTYVDPAKIHHPRFAGKDVSVAGALTSPRPPQGYPVLVQAGSSNDGRAFAARFAEAIFTAQPHLDDAVAFAHDVKGRAAALGRGPESIKILPGLSPFVASTEGEAKALQREFNELTVVEYGLIQLADFAAVELSRDQLDEPVPPEAFAGSGDVTDNSHSRRQVYAGIVERERPTLRQLLHRLAGARGHRVIAGAPEQIADTMQQWFEAGAADGFNVMPPYLPGGLEAFADQVVPLLRERGLFRSEYEGTTLRDHLGLERPARRVEAVA
ncbi:LLM class flavin-dependent oxidoreductase [Conexibacter stalactiti]|uniref:LLM class flavin-dependent oxidoreductase n=1 Tax=Conexibacter stalactiti TaxID=1940611 RepID=A0ABU4HKM1_9ACTN|nr:LLM class flavin-dependent oxidoreductase [Conexibacter stalactiti]MDW5593846.1 LLM class flavin-dependent oxidoreductase [Conexibacter stalactiti]MEC5034488.1 LLM class flavin-dependent oxidoreductase [Conexibacter stalactiti]